MTYNKWDNRQWWEPSPREKRQLFPTGAQKNPPPPPTYSVNICYNLLTDTKHFLYTTLKISRNVQDTRNFLYAFKHLYSRNKITVQQERPSKKITKGKCRKPIAAENFFLSPAWANHRAIASHRSNMCTPCLEETANRTSTMSYIFISSWTVGPLDSFPAHR